MRNEQITGALEKAAATSGVIGLGPCLAARIADTVLAELAGSSKFPVNWIIGMVRGWLRGWRERNACPDRPE